MRSPWFQAALALPLVGYLLSIGWAEAAIYDAPVIELAIEGADPRDLLRGHYLRYRLQNASTEPVGTGDSACVVPSPAGPARTEIYEGSAGRPPRCGAELPVDFVTAQHSFYVQQDRAQALERAVLDGRASIRVAVVSRQRILVRALLVDGRPWQEMP